MYFKKIKPKNLGFIHNVNSMAFCRETKKRRHLPVVTLCLKREIKDR